jgi:hypothetical protein
MVCYVNFLSATSPNTMDGSPARSIVPNHQLHIAGEEGGSATMVAVFCRFFLCCGWLSHLFELVVCRKMVQKKLKEGPARCYLVTHIGVHHTKVF